MTQVKRWQPPKKRTGQVHYSITDGKQRLLVDSLSRYRRWTIKRRYHLNNNGIAVFDMDNVNKKFKVEADTQATAMAKCSKISPNRLSVLDVTWTVKEMHTGKCHFIKSVRTKKEALSKVSYRNDVPERCLCAFGQWTIVVISGNLLRIFARKKPSEPKYKAHSPEKKKPGQKTKNKVEKMTIKLVNEFHHQIHGQNRKDIQ